MAMNTLSKKPDNQIEAEAKTRVEAEIKQAQPPAIPPAAGVPSTRAERMVADAGRGVSTNRDDYIVPMIKILQAQSPECLRQKPQYVAGAKAGDFYLKSTAAPLVEGDKGLLFQPCAFERAWLEFDGPRDSQPKFVARHRDHNSRPANVEGLAKDEDGYDFVSPEGHRFTFSREHYGLVDGRPFMLPFGGSGHTTSREWMTLMSQFVMPGSGAVEPSWNRKYRLTAVPKSNKSGDWYGIRVQPEGGEVTDAEYEAGKALAAAVESGTARGEAPEPEAEDEVPF